MRNRIKHIISKLRSSPEPKPLSKINLYITKYLDPSKKLTFIDIGSHRGDYMDELEQYYQIEKAALIEPTPGLADYLRSKFDRNGISVIQHAISDKDYETINFEINVYGETSSMLPINREMPELSNVDTRLEKTIQVTTRTLDSLVKELQYEKIDLLKIDVQGVEHLALEGGKQALCNTSFVWMELSFKPLYIGSSVFQDIYTMMEKAGFILLEVSPGHRSPANELLQADALFANPKFL